VYDGDMSCLWEDISVLCASGALEGTQASVQHTATLLTQAADRILEVSIKENIYMCVCLSVCVSVFSTRYDL
jgi:hypothetical protein